MAEGHELVALSGSWLQDRIERAGAQFRALPGRADVDFRNIATFAPELTEIPPGYEWLRVAMERFFIDMLPAQHMGLQQALQEFPADVILADDMFFGVLPMLLGPRSERPPIALCGTSILHWCREDGAPHFLGLPPAASPAELDRYAAIAEEYERLTNGPAVESPERVLHELGIGPASLSLFDCVVGLADAYMQLSVPGFEFPREIPKNRELRRHAADHRQAGSLAALGRRSGRFAQGRAGHPGNRGESQL